MNKINLVSPFKKLTVTLGQLPTAYIESMSYYECLTYLVNYITNNIIEVVNENAEAVNELQEMYTELLNYVNHYFDNLNVQEEINNKLDEMTEDGELGGLVMFDNIADMKATEHAVEGNYFETAGATTYDDGHRALYRVRLLDESDVVDELDLVSLTNFPLLVAEKLINYRLDKAENDIDNLESSVGSLESNVGDLENLTTTDKTSIVAAIDEVSDTKIGNLTNLTTTSKSSVVSAINELNSYPIFNFVNTYQAYRGTSDGNTEHITLGKYNISTNTFTTTTSGMSSALCDIIGVTNSDGSVGKMYGRVHLTADYTISSANGYPCIRLKASDFGIPTPDQTYNIYSAGVCYCNDNMTSGNIVVHSDGYIYLYGILNTTASNSYYRIVYPPCVYFFKDFGDTPEIEE